LQEVSAVPRGVLHALELANEDLQKWCGGLSDAELNSRPAGLPPVAFHLRHIARSLDRLLTYAEDRALSPEQVAALKGEMEIGATRAELFAELESALEESAKRVLELAKANLEERRVVGKKALPTTVAACWCMSRIIRNDTWDKRSQRLRLF